MNFRPSPSRPGRPVLLAAFVALVAGCASPRLVLDPIGPASGGHPGMSSEASGLLQVFSATEVNNDGGILYNVHTGYSIHAPDGKRVRSVMNRVGYTDQQPMTVLLPAGSYVVYALSERYGQVEAPVTIVANRLTAVYLESPGMQDTSDVPESALVRLPDGRVAGRRADPAPVRPARSTPGQPSPPQ